MKREKIIDSLSRRNFIKSTAGGAFLMGLGASSLGSISEVYERCLFSKPTKGYVRLNRNENPLGPSPLALEVLKEGNLLYNRYAEPKELEAELARFHKLHPQNVLVGVGSSEILRIAPIAFSLNKGNVITALQAYKTLGRQAENNGIKVKWIPLSKSYHHDLEAMKREVDENTRLMNVCNPNNPTGTVLPYIDLEKFVNALPMQVVTLIDEAYYQYIEDKGYPSAIELIKKGKKVIVSRTFSKAYGMAGLRVGYALASADIIKQMRRFSFGLSGLNIAGREAAKASLRDQDHINKSVSLTKEGREFYYRSLDAMEINYIPSQTPFLMVEVKRDSSQVVKALKKKRMLVRKGEDWQMPSFIRISMGLMEENQICLKALKEVLA